MQWLIKFIATGGDELGATGPTANPTTTQPKKLVP